MRRTVALLVLLLVPSLADGKRDPAEEAYQAARRGYYALKDDANRRKFRHHWLSVVERFQAVAQKYPKSQRAPDALFTSAELLNDLSRISMLDEDVRESVATYSKLVDGFAKHRLADDAALAMGRILLDRTDQPERARAVLSQALKNAPRGDRAAEIRSLLSRIPAKAAPAATPRPFVPRSAAVAHLPATPSEKPAADGERSGDAAAHASKAEASAADSATREQLAAAFARAATEPAAGTTSSRAAAATSEPEAARGQKAETASIVPVATHGSESAGRAAPSSTAGASQGTSLAAGRGVESAAPGGDVAPSASGVPAPTVPVTSSGSGAIADSADAGPDHSGSTSSAPKVAAPAVPPVKRLGEAVKHRADPQVTLAEQLGLKVRRVVIDAGHGGHDSGAVGPKGTLEKDVALDISVRLAEILTERGLEVILTRDEDRYLKLEDRARLANEAKGDLFISVHCNSAAKRKHRGIETYTLNIASDRYSIRLAARENASSEKGMSDLQFILADLATKANTEESTRLATRVQRSLISHLSPRYSGIKDLGTKQALFLVLLGAKMPSILVETSFISNPEEEKRLASKAYQREVAQAIANGVIEFLGNRSLAAKVE